MISFDVNRYCYGCGVCVDVCPSNAIMLQIGYGGFNYPIVDESKCVRCGKCETVCPYYNYDNTKGKNQVLYSAKHLDDQIRHEGSSGSVFYALAYHQIVEKCGSVAGAGFDSDLQLKHKLITSIEEIPILMKSKYIQSDCVGIYSGIKKDLDNGVPVLFVGTPCQCQAILNSVTRDQRELLTIVDFVCHGVPSQDLFNRCISRFEAEYNCRVNSVSFREKDGKNVRTFLIKGVNNTTGEDVIKTGLPQEWSYYNGFLDHTTFRASCFNCQFKKVERSSDITLGDFWGLDKECPDIKDIVDGYSMVVINTEKGLQTIEELKSFLEIKQYPLSIAINNNYAYSKQEVAHGMNRFFLKWNKHFSIKKTESLFLLNKPSFPYRAFRKIVRSL